MTEEWRDVKGFEGAYQVSNLGNVRSVTRTFVDATGVMRTYKGHPITKVNAGKTYRTVCLQYKGRKKQFRVCRLVAENFCPNPHGYTQVNHKDEDKTNDCADNLEWCTPLYNTNYGTGIKRRSHTISRPVNQYTLDGVFIKRWDGITIAQQFYGKAFHITACCKGRLKQTGGFKWEYADNNL